MSSPRKTRPAASGITWRSPSSVSTELPDSGYMRAKAAQEKLIVQSRLPYSIVRATQFHDSPRPSSLR